MCEDLGLDLGLCFLQESQKTYDTDRYDPNDSKNQEGHLRHVGWVYSVSVYIKMSVISDTMLSETVSDFERKLGIQF